MPIAYVMGVAIGKDEGGIAYFPVALLGDWVESSEMLSEVSSKVACESFAV
jgi:hypothetical protein